MKKRVLTLFLALVMCLTQLPVSAVAVEGGGVQAALNQILADYPNGSYFTANGEPCHGNPSNHNCYNCSLYGICDTRGKSIPSGQGNAWTCKAFTAYVGNQVFGITNGRSAPNLVLVSGINSATKKESYDGIRVGDFVYYYSSVNSSLYNYRHTAVCMGATDDTITLYEANSTSNRNQVGIVKYRTVKKTNMKNIHPYYDGVAIYRAANYDQINGTISIADGTYTLTPACAPNARLDVAGGSKENKANVQIYADNGTDAQRWEVKAFDDGYYYISSKASGKVLDSCYDDVSSCQNVVQNRWHIGGYQQWKFKDAGDGYYYLIPLNNENLCLDVSGGGNANGTNVQLYTANQTNAQKWKLTPVDTTTGQTTTGQTTTGQTTTVQTTTRTEYRYGRYVYYDYKLHTCWCETYMKKLFGSAALQYSEWSTTRYSPTGKGWTCGNNCRGNHIGVGHYSDGKAWWAEYSLPDGDYFWEESRTVVVQN